MHGIVGSDSDSLVSALSWSTRGPEGQRGCNIWPGASDVHSVTAYRRINFISPEVWALLRERLLAAVIEPLL